MPKKKTARVRTQSPIKLVSKAGEKTNLEKNFEKVIAKSKGKTIDNLEKSLKQEAKEVERWAGERKKFLIKLAWVVGLVTILLILSHFFLRVQVGG